MEASEALAIIQSLADGVDPITGEVFPEDSPYQHPQVIRALFAAAKALERIGLKRTQERRMPENAGQPWNGEEDKQLCDGFDEGMTISQLAQQHRRTRGAIEARLAKLGKVPPRISFQNPR